MYGWDVCVHTRGDVATIFLSRANGGGEWIVRKTEDIAIMSEGGMINWIVFGMCAGQRNPELTESAVKRLQRLAREEVAIARRVFYLETMALLSALLVSNAFFAVDDAVVRVRQGWSRGAEVLELGSAALLRLRGLLSRRWPS